MSDSKAWAQATEYVLDPLTAPQPSDETGPGSRLRPDLEAKPRTGMITPPDKDANQPEHAHISTKAMSSTMHEIDRRTYPSPPAHHSPRSSRSESRREAFTPSHSRGSSLGERFPGDKSHRPLETLTKEKNKADRSRHVTKKHHVQPDLVDRLDDAAAGGHYHHGGPYDATLWARNNSYNSAPVEATAQGNIEALRATPHEKIVDSVQRHRPLDGVATYPAGESDRDGRIYNYEEGDNMMIANQPEGGAYKRWPGLEYHSDDIKGKSEPSYTIEKSLKKQDADERKNGAEDPRGKAGQHFEMEEGGVRRSGSFGQRISGGLRKRIDSIKRHSRNNSQE